MSLPLAVHRAARGEIIDASAWYEGKRAGLGNEFLTEIDRCMARISTNPGRFALVHGDIRRVVANRFPYAVYFRAERDRIVVLAVFHGSRNPAIWQTRA